MFFFFQAEDGIRDVAVTGVQTCALPICGGIRLRWRRSDRACRASFRRLPEVDRLGDALGAKGQRGLLPQSRRRVGGAEDLLRSGERRVGEEGRSRGAPDHLKKKKKKMTG